MHKEHLLICSFKLLKLLLDGFLPLKTLGGALLLLGLILKGRLEFLVVSLTPVDHPIRAISTLEHFGMDFIDWNDLALKQVAKEQVVVHGLSGYLGNLGIFEFDESVVLGGASGTVATDPQSTDDAELGKVGAHFTLIEAVRDTANIYDPRLSADFAHYARHVFMFRAPADRGPLKKLINV
jgi:hypothetical protein